eukprot:TRINITY_DN56190_c0_g3_i3.p2 TRINITY_DN56190_c0_g3~~TRINITY_DN56190_c0_g3_i3.p2  ORF type:complete len:123 (-),score=5.12 TRINITY_DN56190_c0_g3_i3:19-387(-)
MFPLTLQIIQRTNYDLRPPKQPFQNTQKKITIRARQSRICVQSMLSNSNKANQDNDNTRLLQIFSHRTFQLKMIPKEKTIQGKKNKENKNAVRKENKKKKEQKDKQYNKTKKNKKIINKKKE